jgi:hypothetical protein
MMRVFVASYHRKDMLLRLNYTLPLLGQNEQAQHL